MSSNINKIITQTGEYEENKYISRFDDLVNFIARKHGYFIHSNIIQAGIEAVEKSRTFFKQVEEVCGSKTPLYTEEKIAHDLADLFQKYYEFLLSQKQ